MAEIAVLRTHIINYVKTREVYAAYRKAGYSKKFLAEHEADILLHKAAKQAFDDLGIKKLPTVKSLQAEYATLLEGKKNPEKSAVPLPVPSKSKRTDSSALFQSWQSA